MPALHIYVSEGIAAARHRTRVSFFSDSLRALSPRRRHFRFNSRTDKTRRDPSVESHARSEPKYRKEILYFSDMNN